MPKGFKNAAANAKPVYATVIGSTQEVQRPEAVPETVQTQGRKGAKLPRINMAFTPQNLEYLRIMAGLRGQSITKYVNALVEQDMDLNREAYNAAKRLTGNG
ncbi:MAG: hypothetical protein HDT14_11225 [Oscillibacter sp.]|nr:hypothetical protein [Oscillibacter sp.]